MLSKRRDSRAGGGTHAAPPSSRFGSRSRILLATAALVTGACDDSTGPENRQPTLEINTLTATVSGGAVTFDGVVEAIGGYQHVPSGEGTGIHISATIDGLPFAIHLPGEVNVGTFPVGRWHPELDYVRNDSFPIFFGRTPSLSFGGMRAVALNHYSSLGGHVTIDSVVQPEYRSFNDRGKVWGRLESRAAVDTLRLPEDTQVAPDTVDIEVEFFVELEGWHDGRAGAEFVEGAMAGRTAPELYGSGNMYFVGGANEADPHLVTLLMGELPDSGEPIAFWFGTKLRGPGVAEIETLDLDDIQEPSSWPDHFVAGRVGGIEGRPFAAVSGVLELDSYEEYDHPRWGVAEGRLIAHFDLRAESGGGDVEQTAAEISFHIPSFWWVSWELEPPANELAPALIGQSSTVSWGSR